MTSFTSPRAEAECPSTSNSRLIWRGSIMKPTGGSLPGLAIVAFSIDVKKNPKTHQDSFHIQQSNRRLSAACLELEMLRGRDLRACSFARLLSDEVYDQRSQSDENRGKGGRRARLASLLKGKGPAIADETARDISFSEVECDPDVRLYIDPRCGQTHEWIMSHLCKKDLTTNGWTQDALVVTLDQALEDKQPSELLIFGRMDSSQSISKESHGLIPLHLVVGQRRVAACPRLPRPDDPMPRSLAAISFSNKLKNSTVQPEASEGTIKSRPLSYFKSQPQEVVHQHPANAINRNPFKSTVPDNSKVPTKRHGKVVKRPSNTPGRRLDFNPRSGPDVSNPTILEESLMLTTAVKPSAKRRHDEPESTVAKKIKGRPSSHTETYTLPDVIPDENHYSRERSPSPSPASFASTRHPLPVAEPLLSPSVQSQSRSRAKARQPLGTKKPALPDSASTGPKPHCVAKVGLLSSIEESKLASVDDKGHLKENKALIRKLALESLGSRGVDKSDADFKDLFAAVCRGVQFAMRKELHQQAIDATLAKGFVDGHLAMYRILTPVESVMLALKRTQ